MVLTILVGVPYSALQKIVLPFGRYIWMSVCAILIVVIFAIYIIKCFKWYNHMDNNTNTRNSNPIFNIINIFLGASIARMVLNNYVRCILTFWMLTTLVLRNAYQGSLFNFLQAQIEHSPWTQLPKSSSTTTRYLQLQLLLKHYRKVRPTCETS